MSARLSASLEAEIVDALRSRIPRARVARRFGYSERTIRRIADAYEIPGVTGAPGLDPELHPRTPILTDEERRRRRLASCRGYRERKSAEQRAAREGWGQPKTPEPVDDLAKGRTRWRCHQCDHVQSGTHCANGHEAPWVPLTLPIEALR